MLKKCIVLMLAALVLPVAVSWGQTVTAGSGGTFPTLAAAITSFRVGGSNAGNPAPNVIDCLDATYDESLPRIDVQLTINGKAPRSTLLLQQVTGGNDGLEIVLPGSTQVDLNDLIFLPSVTTPPGDDLFWIEGTTGDILNFNNCIVSSNYSGAPASPDGITAPVGSATARVTDKGIGIIGALNGLTVNFAQTIIVDAAGTSSGFNDNVWISGAGAKTVNFTDGCVISYATRLNFQANQGTLNITGTHDKPIYIIKAQDATYGHGIGVWLEYTGSVNLTYCIIADNVVDGLSIVEESKTVTMNHVIVANNGRYGICFEDVYATGYLSTVTAEDVTVSGNQGTFTPAVTKDQIVLIANLLNPSSFTGCIIANGDNGFNIGTTSVANAINSAIVLSGPDALTAKKIGAGTLNETNVITDDPQFTETTNFLSPAYFDVYNTAYGTAKGGSALSGGADYAAAPPTPTPFGFADVHGDWSIYW